MDGGRGGEIWQWSLIGRGPDGAVVEIFIGQGVARGIVASVEPAAEHGGAVLRTIRPADPPLSEARSAWARDMARRSCKPASIAHFIRYLDLCCAFTGWSTVGSVTLTAAMEFLAHRRADGWSGSTHDQCASALRSFGEYMRKAGLTAVNILQDLEPSGDRGEEGSRALTLDEARAIVRVARERETADRRAKGNRALFYAVLLHTGLRAAEAGAIKWKDIALDGEAPQITSDPKWSKNRRRQRVMLCPEITWLLREHKRASDGRPERQVFPIVPNRPTWHDTRERAGVALADDRGRAATMHSCRKYLATALDRSGASPGIVARILRHATGITQERYIDPCAKEEIEAVGRLPNLWPDGDLGGGTQSGPVGDEDENGKSRWRERKSSDRLPLSDSETPVPMTTHNPVSEARAAVAAPSLTIQGTSASARASGSGLGAEFTSGVGSPEDQYRNADLRAQNLRSIRTATADLLEASARLIRASDGHP